MSKTLEQIAVMSVPERKAFLDVLVSHLESGSQVFAHERRFAAGDRLEELATRLRSERNSIVVDRGDLSMRLISQAIGLLANLYDGRDPGWGLLH